MQNCSILFSLGTFSLPERNRCLVVLLKISYVVYLGFFKVIQLNISIGTYRFSVLVQSLVGPDIEPDLGYKLIYFEFLYEVGTT